MKIKRAVIENFKGIRHLDINFCDPHSEEPHQITAILGDNGSGKTSVLQALWLNLVFFNVKAKPAIGNAWEGLVLDRISSMGDTRIELILSDEEGREIPSNTIFFADGGAFDHKGLSPERFVEALEELHNKLSEVFFFTQNRNIGLFKTKEGFKNRSLEQDWSTGVSNLRRALGDWWLAHVSPEAGGGKDYIKELETSFSRIYPGTRFVGVQLNPAKVGGWKTAPDVDNYFLMEREGKKYDIAEMSSGEQAVFTILFEFVRNDIKKGIILIDELELHLHPPEQQALLAALPKIGPDCQFIITTHSSFLEDIIPDRHEIRLEGGRLCL